MLGGGSDRNGGLADGETQMAGKERDEGLGGRTRQQPVWMTLAHDGFDVRVLETMQTLRSG
jgi:hypothetical protein